MMMTKPRLAALTFAGLLALVTACSGNYGSQIQGSYGSSFKRGVQALRANDYESAERHLSFAAGSGHPRALLSYGQLFSRGQGVERDPVRAAALFEEAHGKTSEYKGKAALQLGLLLLNGGEGPSGTVQQDPVRARELLLEALDDGQTKAAGKLAKIYDKGLGVKPDTTRAINYYRQAASSDASAAGRLAVLLVNSGASKGEVAWAAGQAVSQLEAKGEAGNDKAWLQLAEIYARGKIVDADSTRAIAYLEKLPDDNDPAMNLRLARLYGQAGDRREQRRRLRLAADAGDRAAQTQLAKLFLQPGTRATNGAVGRYYAERAIGQKSEEAMVYLGLALVRGDVLQRDPGVGETLLRRAHKKGNLDATTALGGSILRGDIQARKPDEGKRLLERAAKKGSSDAMSALGFAYHLGRGLPKDEKLSVRWLRKASDAGNREAREFLVRRQRT